MRKMWNKGSLTAVLLLAVAFVVQAPKSDDGEVKFIRVDGKKRVDVIINGSLFTSYQYSEKFKKPILFPVNAPGGQTITRGYPIDPRPGERVDHPHQTGLWFNYGDVNGIDFWNNSSDIPPAKKDLYGHIVNQKIVKTENGREGILEVVMNWNDNKGKTLLTENAKYIFSGNSDSRTIDHISVLTAVETVVIGDSKEGMLAIRVDRAFEMPSNEALIFTDAQGNPTSVKRTDNKDVTGMYLSSNGLKGDSVWGTRNEWVMLSGRKDNVIISMAMFDNPKNPGFPAYAHARGYGLFSINNFGQNSYDPKKEKRSFKLEKGESVTLYHRFYVQSGKELLPDEANWIFREFSKKY